MPARRRQMLSVGTGRRPPDIPTLLTSAPAQLRFTLRPSENSVVQTRSPVKRLQDTTAASSAAQRSNFAMTNLSTAPLAKPDELHRGPVDDDHGGTHAI